MWGAQAQPGYYEQQQGCCGPANPQQPSVLCPTDPNIHCCNTNPNEPGTFQGCVQCCDVTTWAIGFFALASIVTFGVVLGTATFDNIFALYQVHTTGELQKAIFPDVVWNQSWNATVISSSNSLDLTCQLSGFWCRRSEACSIGTYAYSGSFGSICMEDSMTAIAMVLNLSYWINFRGTLFFIAMLGSLFTLLMLYAVHRQKNPQQWGAQPQAAPPIGFFGTPFYYMFRTAWAVSSVIIFLWVANVMYQYWSFNAFYMNNSRGQLRTFWRLFNEKFEWSVISVTIFLCWPLMHIVLEVAFFVAGIIPWCAIRNACYPQLQSPRDPEVPEDDQSCCVRTDNFYTEFLQARRLGFSDGQWRLMTGARETFFAGMDAGPPPGAYPPHAMPPQMAPRPVPPPGMPSGPMTGPPPQARGWGGQEETTPSRHQSGVLGASGSTSGGFFSGQQSQSWDAAQPNKSHASQMSEDDGSDAEGSGKRRHKSSKSDDEGRKREKREKREKRDKSDKKEKREKRDKE